MNLTSTPTNSQVSPPTFHVAFDVSEMDSCYRNWWNNGNPPEQPRPEPGKWINFLKFVNYSAVHHKLRFNIVKMEVSQICMLMRASA